MRYTLLFGLLGCVLAVAGLTGGSSVLLLWPAASMLALAVAYAGLGPRVCGKQPDGRLAPWAVILLLPYLLPTWVVWHFSRLITRKSCCHEVTPGLWLGRRAFARELPPGIGLVVDLTAEFAEPRGVRSGRGYHCVPTLDATATDLAALRLAVEKVVTWPGAVYVHCAQGNGRSALLAAAVLVRRGLAPDARYAVQMLRQVRPGVRLTSVQRRTLDRLTSEHPPDPSVSTGVIR
jgi:protein-tyrosine phosphatase